VPVPDVQATLRRWFERWGCPGLIQVDNGHPWGGSRDLPPPLALWLLGLGVGLAWIPPHRPQENGVVENSHGTGQRWVETERCATAEEAQRRADEEDRLQREAYPLADGRPRWLAYPWLRHSGRGYCVTWEAQVWSIGPVWDWLAGRSFPRRADCQGRVSVYGWNRLVGLAYAGTEVVLRVAAADRLWVAHDARGEEIRRWPAEELTAERICGLKVSRERLAARRKGP
jgi:hypothetical protein